MSVNARPHTASRALGGLSQANTSPTNRRLYPRRTTAMGALALAAAFAASTATAVSASASVATLKASSANTARTSAIPAPPKQAVNLSETGSTLLYPLFQAWAPAYHRKYRNITITPQGTGSGTGISQAEAGTVDIGASDAYLSPTIRATHPGLMNIPLAISAQQVNYNVPGIPKSVHLKLDGPLLASIYEGKTTQWDAPAIKALNPGVKLPSTKIVALHRSDGSGDTFIFTTYLSSSDPDGWGKSIGYGTTVAFPAIPNALGEEGNGGMVTGCAATPGCVAYIGISYLGKTQAAGLGEAMLKNASGRFLLPVTATIGAEAAALTAKTPPDEALSLVFDKAANGYPIINYEYAIVPERETSGPVAQAVKAFLSWALAHNGGSTPGFLDAVHFQPLPPGVVTLSERQIAKISG